MQKCRSCGTRKHGLGLARCVGVAPPKANACALSRFNHQASTLDVRAALFPKMQNPTVCIHNGRVYYWLHLVQVSIYRLSFIAPAAHPQFMKLLFLRSCKICAISTYKNANLRARKGAAVGWCWISKLDWLLWPGTTRDELLCPFLANH
jgi:hypothetical protein